MNLFVIFFLIYILGLTNYCPISILPVISDVYEKVFKTDSIIISLLITYYHHLNLASDLGQAPNTLY